MSRLSWQTSLASKADAIIIMAFGERLPGGRGFNFYLTKVDDTHPAQPGD